MLGTLLVLQLPHSAISAVVRRSTADPQIPSYNTLHSEIESELSSGKRNLVDWAVELLKKDPQDAKEAFLKIEVMLRVGLEDHAIKTIKQLRAFYPEQNHPTATPNTLMLLRLLTQEFPSFPAAAALLETFPEHINNSSLPMLSQLIQQCQRGEGKWNQEQIESWLLKRQTEAFKNRTLLPQARQNDPRYNHRSSHAEPWRLEHKDRPGTIWLTLRLQNRQSQMEKAELLDQLEKEARQNPADTLKMLDFLFAWQTIRARNHRPKQDGSDLAWVAEVAEPKATIDAYYIGVELVKARQWEPAKKMLQKALDYYENSEKKSARDPIKRLTMANRGTSYKESILRLIKQCDARIPKTSSVKPPLSSSNSSASTSSPKQDEENQRRQEQREKALAKVRESIKKDEALLRQEEARQKHLPSYWARLASLYVKIPIPEMTQEELDKTENAYKEALKLRDPKNPSKEPPRYGSDRWHLLSSYINLLRQQKKDRKEEEFKLLLKEIEIAPPEGRSLHMATQYLTSNQYLPFLKPNEPILWSWLENRKTWSHPERTVLHFMARKAQDSANNSGFFQSSEAPEEVYAFVEKIEKLAKQGDPSRTKLFAEMLIGMSPLGIEANPQWASHIIQERLKQDDLDNSQRAALASDLFRAYLQSKHFEEAEKLLENKTYQLRNRSWFTQLATMAALNGKKEIAMRNWQRSANFALKDRQQIQLNRTLQQHGLGDSIDAYYKEVKKKLPDFEIP